MDRTGIDTTGSTHAPLHGRRDAADAADELLGEGELGVGVALHLVAVAFPGPLC